MNHLPLRGIRVLDLSRVLAGPLCTMMLGDLGADVMKVERTGTGDETRGWGPPFASSGQSAYFLSINRNKLSVAADFRLPNDRQLIAQLAAGADVVVDNFVPNALMKQGIDAGAMLAKNDQLIWCSISGFGENSERPGYDFVLQAESGWMAITGPESGPPYKVGVALVDVISGKDAAIAILAALVGRGQTRAPGDRHLSITLRGSATAALVNVAQNALVAGTPAKRWGNAHPNLVPYQLFDTADRPLVLAVGNDSQWAAAVIALDLPELAANDALTTNAGRLAHRDAIVTVLANRLASENAAQWVAVLERAGVPCGVVRGVVEALGDVPSSAETGIQPATGGQIRRLPPSLNEHGELIRKMHWSAFEEVPILGGAGARDRIALTSSSPRDEHSHDSSA